MNWKNTEQWEGEMNLQLFADEPSNPEEAPDVKWTQLKDEDGAALLSSAEQEAEEDESEEEAPDDPDGDEAPEPEPIYFPRLNVTDQNIPHTTVGGMLVNDEDGVLYTVNVERDGTVVQEEKQIENDNIADATITGSKLEEATITSRELDMTDLFADSAMINQMIAENLDAEDLFKNEEFLTLLKEYILEHAVSKLGDTMEGLLELADDPVEALHAVTKQYLEARTYALNEEKITGVLPVEKGGTGATNPATARDNLGAVPNTRTVNGKALSANISLSHGDVGAASTAVATTSANGLMSATDKTKLNGIATGANNYTHPNSGVGAGTYRQVTVNAQGHVTGATNPTVLVSQGGTGKTTQLDAFNELAKNGGTMGGALTLSTAGVLSNASTGVSGDSHMNLKFKAGATTSNHWSVSSTAGNRLITVHNNDSRSIDLRTPLAIASGGTGRTDGKVAELATSRNFRVNLASTTAAGFTGAADCTPGVTGVLDPNNGGTGVKSISALKTELNIDDTGWVDLTLLNGFTRYQGNSSHAPRIRRIGKIVYFYGEISPPSNSGMAGSTGPVQFATIQAQFTPVHRVNVLCQGSGNKVWMLTVSTSGVVNADRYRNGSTSEQPGITSWLPFSVTWMVG